MYETSEVSGRIRAHVCEATEALTLWRAFKKMFTHDSSQDGFNTRVLRQTWDTNKLIFPC
jgi:hypothetical protein